MKKKHDKFLFDRLLIEITRKCNMHCLHCAKGDAQNITITPEIIDRMFSQCSHIDRISIVDGETFLELDMLKYLLDSIDKYKLNTQRVSMVTNGTICDSKVIEIFNDFVSKQENRSVSISVSDDYFHDADQTNYAVAFYNSLEFKSDRITVVPYSQINGLAPGGKDIWYAGRAKKYINDRPEEFFIWSEGQKPPTGYLENTFRGHRICIEENAVKCKLQLCANGLLTFADCGEYENDDRLAIGNVMSKPLKNILQEYNRNCPYLCDECFNETTHASVRMLQKFTDLYKQEELTVSTQVIQRSIDAIWRVRQLAQETFPRLPVTEIIKLTPVDIRTESISAIMAKFSISKDIFDNTLQKYMAKFPNMFIPTLGDITNLNCALQLMETVLNENNASTGVYPFLSKDELRQSYLFHKFANLEKAYINHQKKEYAQIDTCELIPGTSFDWDNVSHNYL